jgi:hypothetical protein
MYFCVGSFIVNLNIQKISLIKTDSVQLTRLSNVACLVLKFGGQS